MRYHFYKNTVADVKLAIAIDIMRGKYRIGEPMPIKLKLVEEYDISRPAFDTVCEGLEQENVICVQGDKMTALYVPQNTTAASYVMRAFTNILKESSRMLELLGFGAREARNQLYLKEIVNTLPLKLKEMEDEGKIQICGNAISALWHSSNTISDNGIDEDIMINPNGYEDIINILQDIL